MTPAKRFLLAALGAASFALSAPAEEPGMLPWDEARRVAVEAGLAGNAPVAAALADRILAQDPKDASGLLAMSTVHLARGAFSDAYRMSRRAFRFSKSQTDRFQAARIASVAALADKRIVMSQFWLRRAGDLAPTPVHRAKIERNFRMLRAETPWRYKFSLSATPSDNVNGGSDHAYNVIDGTPYVGTLDGAAMALAGANVQSSASFSYRFARTEKSQSELTGSLFVKRVILTPEARMQAPGFDPHDLSVTSWSLGVAHTRVVGSKGTILRFETGLRDTWAGGERKYSAFRLSTMISRRFWENVRLTGAVDAEARNYSTGRHAMVTSVKGIAAYSFANGATLSALVNYADNQANLWIFDNTVILGKLSYSFGKPVLGMDLTAGVGASFTNYPDYTMIVIPVPGGRQDTSIFFDVEAKLTKFEYAGFSPTLRVRRAITDSNVSRFDTSEWAVSMGIASNF